MRLSQLLRPPGSQFRAIAAPIRIEFLKSGKLVSGLDEHVPDREGYSITRRSAGVGRYGAVLSSKQICGERLNIYDIDRETLGGAGVFVLRRMPAVAAELPPKMIMMRARFIPEAGRGAGGRIFEQAEFWLVERSDWTSHPGEILADARNRLIASTDSINEPASSRLNAGPILLDRVAFGSPDTCLEIEAAANGTLAILHRILDAGDENGFDHGAGRLEFGLASFKDEEAFLNAAIFACNVLAHVRHDHPNRAWVERRLDNVMLCTGYSGRFGGSASPCITFRRSDSITPPSVDRAAVLSVLERLVLPGYPPGPARVLAEFQPG